MGFLFRTIYRNIFVNGIPLHQLLIGLVLVPIGIIVTWAALFGDSTGYYPSFALFGVAFAILGVILFVKGARGLLASKNQLHTTQEREIV